MTNTIPLHGSKSGRQLTVFCGSRHGSSPAFLDAARALGEGAAKRGMSIVYGGARVGLMGAVADGALAQGGRVVGIIPGYLKDREVLHPNLTETHVVDDLFQRKAMMLELGDAFVSLPGGFGTLDEFFEVASWIQLRQLTGPNLLLNIEGYFDPLLKLLEHTVSHGFADLVHLENIAIADSVAAALPILDPEYAA